MTIGERIRERRKELGMSQEELAQKVGFSGKTSISRIERSTGRLQSDIILKVAPALGMSPAALMTGSEYHEYVWNYYKINDDDIRLIDNFHCLTVSGQNKLEQYLYDLLKNPDNVVPGAEPYMDMMPEIAKGGEFYEYYEAVGGRTVQSQGNKEWEELFSQLQSQADTERGEGDT